MTGKVSLQISGSLARVTLSHPGKFNAMSRAMWLELRSVFIAIHEDRQIRCVLINGEGGHFCSGGDISEYVDFRFAEQSLRDFHENEVWGGLQAMLHCDVPIVAQISGNCMGAGLEISSCCDLRIAGESARFGAPIAKLGFPMAPREAALADADLAAAVRAQVGRIVSLAPVSARLNKQTFRTLAGHGQGIHDLVTTAYAYADSHEHREGIAAFTEKRPARFAT